MSGSNWWQFPVLAAVKFRENWSHEAAGFDATYSALPDEQRERHWLSRHFEDLSAVAQYFHALILMLAAVGFWRNRSSSNLAFLGAVLLAFMLLHVFLEVDCRYHFGVQSLLAIAGAGAFPNLRNSDNNM